MDTSKGNDSKIEFRTLPPKLRFGREYVHETPFRAPMYIGANMVLLGRCSTSQRLEGVVDRQVKQELHREKKQ